MCQAGNLIKYICEDCKSEFWVQSEDQEPRFCPFCEMAKLTKVD